MNMKSIFKISLMTVGISLFLSGIIPLEVHAVSSSMSVVQQSNSLSAISSSTASNATSLSVTMTINGQNLNELKNRLNSIIDNINNTQIVTPQQKIDLVNTVDQQISVNAAPANITLVRHGCAETPTIQVCW